MLYSNQFQPLFYINNMSDNILSKKRFKANHKGTNTRIIDYFQKSYGKLHYTPKLPVLLADESFLLAACHYL